MWSLISIGVLVGDVDVGEEVVRLDPRGDQCCAIDDYEPVMTYTVVTVS